MRLLWLCFFFYFVNATNSTQKLYYYGEPIYTSESGFIKLDINSGWDVAANGFATSQVYPAEDVGFVINSNSTNMIMYGAFSLWNNSWVGCLLKVDPTTMKVSPFNSGLLGSPVASMTFFQNDTRIALIGDFYSFQNNPNTQLNHVAACTADGENCYPLGSGLPDFMSAGVINSGTLKSIGDLLYAYYLNVATQQVIEFFNVSSTDTNQQWTTIYTSNWTTAYQVTMDVYQNDLWIVGCIWVTSKQAVSAARWNSAENSWEYRFNTTNFCDSSQYNTPVTTVSPDGQTLYLTFQSQPSQIYEWNDTIHNWELFYEDTCNQTVIAARQNGLLIACNAEVPPSVVMYVENGIHKENLPDLICEGVWVQLKVNSQDNQLYAFCQYHALLTYSFNLTKDTISASNNVTDFEILVVSLDGMCVYGQKILITGVFDQVGNTSASALALWDNQYKKWYTFENQTYLSYCQCDTDGFQVAVVCSQPYPEPLMLMLDWADSDTGSGNSPQHFQMIPMTNMTECFYTVDFQMAADNTIYIAAVNDVEQIAMYRWTSETGASLLTTFYGNQLQFQIEEDIAFLIGSFYPDAESNVVTTARFNVTSMSWLPMDQLLSTLKTNGAASMIVPWNATGKMYVCGRFAWVGSMKASNWAGYNSEGQGEDSVEGGLPSSIVAMAPVGDLMYLIVRSSSCISLLDPTCNTLVYYDGSKHTYSNVLARGVGNIATGPVETPIPDSISSDSKSFASEYGVIIILFIAVLLVVLVFLGAAVFYRSTKKKEDYSYQEIPDVESEPIHPIGAIDFQHEEFMMKSVLGRGAYGTVWSCLFPHRAAATYAVKQMLLSKGDTKRIETVQHEIDILEKLRHPYLVHYCGHRVETSNTSIEFFIFMELYEQPCSLKGVIQKRQKQSLKTGKRLWFTYNEVKKYLFQMADALNYLHREGVAHRDLKCANLLIRAKGSFVNSIHIADFGISKIMDSESAAPLASTMLGTPSFMAPEILKNQPYDPFKADIWSFGMTMYEMLSWEDPQTPGKKPTFGEDAIEHLNSDDHFASVLEILDRCLQQEPMARPDAAELLFLCENLP